MKFERDTIIVGGLPKPIGGVTTYLRRMLLKNFQSVVAFVDLYPSTEKQIPPGFKGKYISAKSKFVCMLKLCETTLRFRSDVSYFFNFSKLNALLVFCVLPKFRNVRWSLVLHHGNLSSHVPGFLVKILLSRFDCIYAIGNNQRAAYESLGVSLYRIQVISTFVEPQIDMCNVGSDVVDLLERMSHEKKKVIVASGFPRALYQHDVSLKLIDGFKDRSIMFFLYGEGELKSKFRSITAQNIFVFFDVNEDVFNYALKHADLYVRPTLKDSFGVACADAVYFGTSVVASDVCERAIGVCTYPVSDSQCFIRLCDEYLC